MAGLSFSSTAALGVTDSEEREGPAQPSAQVRRGLEEGRARAEAREAYWRSPAAKRERAASRGAYRGQSAQEALRTGQEAFPSFLTAPVAAGVPVARGQRVARYLSDFSAQLFGPDGHGAIVRSSVPMLGREPNGQKSPLDLHLVDLGDGFSPRSSSSQVRLPKHSTAPLRFPAAGFAIRFDAASERDATVSEDRIYFPNIDEDADAWAAPTPLGAMLGFVLRSPSSPERYDLRFSLPPGGSLRLTSRATGFGDQGTIDVLDRAGEVVGHVATPSALDAQGQPVAVAYRQQSEDRVAVTVDHRSKDLAYPLMVDPLTNTYHGDIPLNWYVEGNANSSGTLFATNANGYARVYGLPSPYPFGFGTYKGWYADIHAGAYVYNLHLAHVYHWANNSAEYGGVDNRDAGAWQPGSWRDSTGQSGNNGAARYQNLNGSNISTNYCPGQPNPALCTVAPPPPPKGSVPGRNRVYHGLYMWGFSTAGVTPTSDVYRALFYESDDQVPTLGAPTHSGLPSGWVETFNASSSLTGSVTTGLGMSYIKLTGPGISQQKNNPNCPYYPCAFTQTSSFTYNSTSLPEGSSTLQAVAVNAGGNQSQPRTWQVRIDRSAPRIDVTSGSLWDRRNQASDHRYEGLYDATAPLHVEAVDDYSGTRSVEIYVDGISQRSRGGYVTIDCPTAGGCRRTLDWTLRPDDYTDGDHTIRIVARDQLADPNGSTPNAHTAIREAQVTVDRRGSIHHGTPYSGDPSADGGLDVDEWAKIDTHTSRSEGLDFIKTRAPVPCDDGQPAGPQCAELRIRTHDSQIDSSNKDGYASSRGTSENDPEVDEAADLLEPARYTEEPVATGSIYDVLAAWQHPPPAHAPQYELYELEGEEAVSTSDVGGEASDQTPTVQFKTRLWIDAETKMPLKQVTVDPDGVESAAQYWTYARGRLEDNEVPSDFFRVPPPSSAGQETSVRYRGTAPLGPQTDPDSGGTFAAYDLGSQVAVAGLTYCLANTARIFFREPDVLPNPGDDPDAQTHDLRKIDTVQSYYNVLGASETCTPGIGSLMDPTLMIATYAKGSQIAAALRDEVLAAATGIQFDPLDTDFLRAGTVAVLLDGSVRTAYAMPNDSDSISAIVETDTTTILINGRLSKADLPALATELEVR